MSSSDLSILKDFVQNKNCRSEKANLQGLLQKMQCKTGQKSNEIFCRILFFQGKLSSYKNSFILRLPVCAARACNRLFWYRFYKNQLAARQNFHLKQAI
jgi:hypothetical protein